jgi:prepilin-type N-terminal cleavage/methylation domain-containing protein
MTYKNKAAARGFTIIELLIVMAIVAVVALATAKAARNYFLDRQAQQVADSISLIGKATALYLSKNAATIPTTPSDLPLAQLIFDNDLPANYTGALPWGGTNPYYAIRIQRIPSGATSLYKALVYTKTAWVVDGKVRYDLVGNAMRKIGGAGGMLGDPALPPPPAGAGPAGLNAQWAEPTAAFPPSATSPYLASGGQLFYNVAYSMASLDAIYLRTDGTNQMNAALNMGTHVINSVTDVNASGTVNAATVTATNIGATSSIVSNGVINAAGTITGSGAINAGGTVTAANVSTAGTVTANAVNSGTVLASNTITATNDITTTTGKLSARTDVLITDLGTRDGTPLTTSLKTLAPRLVEMKNYIIDTDSTNAQAYNVQIGMGNRGLSTGTYAVVDGTVIPNPGCTNSGVPNIFIIPAKEGGVATGGKFGFVAKAVGSGPWTLSITDMQFTGAGPGNSIPNEDVPNFAGVVRVFCSY